MIRQLKNNIFLVKLLSGLNDRNNKLNALRYVTFKARETNNQFGFYTPHGFSEKLEGKIIIKAWKEIPVKFPDCVLGEHVLKPDTFSGIIMLDSIHAEERQNRQYLKILIYFKNRSTELLNKLHGTHGRVFWQNNYEEITISEIESLKEVLTLIKKSA